MSYNIIGILKALDARTSGLEQIKKEPTVHFLIRFDELGKWSLLISDGDEQEPILLHVPLKFIYFYFTSHVIRNKTKFDLPKNMDFVGDDYEIMSKIIGYTS
jgi:hypothetical protein